MSLIRLLVIDKNGQSLAERLQASLHEQNMAIVVEFADSASSALYALTVDHYDVIVCYAPIAHIDAVRWIHHVTTLAPLADIVLIWSKSHPAFKSVTPPLSRVRVVNKSVASLQLAGIVYKLVQQRIHAIACRPLRQREGIIRKVMGA